MACNEKWESILEKYLTEELTDDDQMELNDHLKTCTLCAEFIRDLEDLENSLTDLAEEPPVDLVALALEKTKPKKNKTIKIFAIAAAAIFLIMLLGTGQLGYFSQTSVTAAEIAARMNRTLQGLDALELKIEHVYFKGDEVNRSEEHQVLKKPNKVYYSMRKLEGSTNPSFIREDFQFIKNGYREYEEYSNQGKIIQKSLFNDSLNLRGWYYDNWRETKDMANIMGDKIHKDFEETTLNNRTAYKIKTEETVREDDTKEVKFFKSVKLIWVDKETYLPLKTELYREGASKPYRIADIKIFKTSDIDEAVFEIPVVKREKSAGWKKVSLQELKEKAPNFVPPAKIKDWKATLFTFNGNILNLKAGEITGTEYQNGLNRLILQISSRYNPYMLIGTNNTYGKVEGVPYLYVFEDFWLSKLVWQEKNKIYSIEGTIPLAELHQLAMELRDPVELKKQQEAQKNKVEILEELRVRQNDVIETSPDKLENKVLESYYIDYLYEYTKVGSHTETHRIIDIFRAPFERHIEIYKGDQATGSYALLAKNATSHLKIDNDPNSKVRINKEVPPDLVADSIYQTISIPELLGSGFNYYFSVGFFNTPMELPYWINTIEKENSWPVGVKIIERSSEPMLGRKAKKTKIELDSEEITFWVDSQTGLTLRVEVEQRDKSQTVVTALDLKINPKINDRLFNIKNNIKNTKLIRGDDRYPNGSANFSNLKRGHAVTPVTIEEARDKASFRLFEPDIPEEAKLANVWAGFNDQGKIGVVYLDYRFPGNKTLLIKQELKFYDYIKKGYQGEYFEGAFVTDGFSFPFHGKELVTRFQALKEETDIYVTSTLDKGQIKEIIGKLK